MAQAQPPPPWHTQLHLFHNKQHQNYVFARYRLDGTDIFAAVNPGGLPMPIPGQNGWNNWTNNPATWPLPVGGVYTGVTRDRLPLGVNAQPQPLAALDRYQAPLRVPALTLEARRRRNTTRQKLQPRGLTFVQPLSFNSNGVIVLFNRTVGPNLEHFIAKYRPNGIVQIAQETLMAMRHDFAMHVVQRKPFPPLNAPVAQNFQNVADIILFEYLPRGSLDKSLTVVNKSRYQRGGNRGRGKNLVFEERQLWYIFHCLTKQLIAIAFPPLQHQGAVLAQPVQEQTPPHGPESCPPSPQAATPPFPPYPSRIWIPPFDPATDADDDDLHIPFAAQRHPGGDAHFVPRPGEPVDLDAQRYPDPGRPGRNWRRVWSYGGWLLHNSEQIGLGRLSEELRTLIAWCLCDDPYYRPRLRVLERRIREAMRRRRYRDEMSGAAGTGVRRGNRNDRDLQRWVAWMFDVPHEYWE
ncbi:hypothetical protein VTJ49DRAFT_5561 [Mycothermus thermophilus]|uniref:Protein kinase domain-containing protein n=1 Tax=Humicola insolens TaxID=85995 RepID=A0ABR3V411_HUMIN